MPEGVGYNVINRNGWKAGPLAKIRFGREEDSGGSPFLVTGRSDALRGLGDVDTAAEIGGFAQYSYAKIRARLELRQGFGGHDGLIADGSLRYADRQGPMSYAIGPRMSFGSSDFLNTYYGITAGQSANSGLAPYRASTGIAAYGIGGMATLPLTEQVAMTFLGGYDRLGNEAADSPLIRERGDENQFTFGVGVGYRFGWQSQR